MGYVWAMTRNVVVEEGSSVGSHLLVHYAMRDVQRGADRGYVSLLCHVSLITTKKGKHGARRCARFAQRAVTCVRCLACASEMLSPWHTSHASREVAP